MRVRTLYFKVVDMDRAVTFWEALLEKRANRKSDRWSEFPLEGARLGLLLNDFEDDVAGSGGVPVFELEDAVIDAHVQRAVSLGASIVVDGLNDPKMNSIVLAAPDGHEFEICRCHRD